MSTSDVDEEIEFVNKDLKIQVKCPICHSQMLEDVYQTGCCGKLACHTCDSRLKKDGSNCFNCREQYKSHPDKNARGLIQDLKMHCPNAKKGCKWIGEVRDRKNHIKKGERDGDKVCKFEVIECCYGCKRKDTRKNMDKHEPDCPEKPYKCQYCKETIKQKDEESHMKSEVPKHLECAFDKFTQEIQSQKKEIVNMKLEMQASESTRLVTELQNQELNKDVFQVNRTRTFPSNHSSPERSKSHESSKDSWRNSLGNIVGWILMD
uniref:TRAF-type domain-containing protein n=1 Tax=Amphimedon queenslandica TaxID=400682 RepID=A0A1X7TAL5_AMPQE